MYFKANVLSSDDLQGAQSEAEAKQEMQQLHRELVAAQELARTSKQKCSELQGETHTSLLPWGVRFQRVCQAVWEGGPAPTAC